ncbi:MAG: SprT family zinc-dependent metalloprotease [Aquisalimonadaceae bacterium]
MQHGTVILDGEAHTYRVRYSRRKTLGLYLSRSNGIEVRAPGGCPAGIIRGFVEGRAAWLSRNLQRIAAAPLPPRWEDGAEHLLLGEAVRLRVTEGRRAAVSVNGAELMVSVTEHTPERVEAAVRAWYRRYARELFQASLNQWFPALGLPERQRPPLKIRAMRRRWGSCASHGGINLNLWLVRAPRPCVDYVVVHELCHLREFNHGPGFHALMDRVMPDWRQHREALREHERACPPGSL